MCTPIFTFILGFLGRQPNQPTNQRRACRYEARLYLTHARLLLITYAVAFRGKRFDSLVFGQHCDHITSTDYRVHTYVGRRGVLG